MFRLTAWSNIGLRASQLLPAEQLEGSQRCSPSRRYRSSREMVPVPTDSRCWTYQQRRTKNVRERERERARGRGWEEGEGEEEEEKDPLAAVFHVNSIRCPVSSIQAMYNVTRDVQWRTTANIAKCKAQCAPPIPPLPLHPAAHLGVHGSLPSLLKLQHRIDLTGSWAHSVRPWITKQGEEWQHTVRIRRMYLQYPYVLDKATYQEEVRVCTSIWHMYHAWHIFNPWGWQKESRLGCNKNNTNPDHWFLHPTPPCFNSKCCRRLSCKDPAICGRFSLKRTAVPRAGCASAGCILTKLSALATNVLASCLDGVLNGNGECELFQIPNATATCCSTGCWRTNIHNSAYACFFSTPTLLQYLQASLIPCLYCRGWKQQSVANRCK